MQIITAVRTIFGDIGLRLSEYLDIQIHSDFILNALAIWNWNSNTQYSNRILGISECLMSFSKTVLF